jgi:plasmid stabilization system protein ParE
VSGYILSVDAECDLQDIWEYIASDSIDAADRWILRLYGAFEALSRSPAMGHRREDVTDYDVRFWAVGKYLIVYRIQAGQIAIVAVSQGSRDIPSFLRRRL